jgi:hypothetical protein
MKKSLILPLIVCLIVAGCSDSGVARKALDGAGYTKVHLSGYEWGACGENDSFATGFMALGPTGKPVTGVVCSGWMKGATIRTF